MFPQQGCKRLDFHAAVVVLVLDDFLRTRLERQQGQLVLVEDLLVRFLDD